MVGQTRKKRRLDHFKRIRVAIAREIVRNGLNTLSLTDDIQHNLHITELLDEYTIRLLIEWLSTRFGSNICTRYVESGNKVEPVKDENVFEDLLLYPFLDTGAELISEPLQKFANRLLDDAFTPSTELIGGLYEHICNRPLVGDCNDTLDLAPDIQSKDKRRPVGQFYTPPNIVRYCFDRYIEADSNKFMKAIKVLSKVASNADRDQAAGAQATGFKILDPACGAGNFLIGAIKLASDIGCNETGLIKFACRCLFGMDLDGKSVSLARIAVILELCHQAPAFRKDRAIQKYVLTFLRRNIVTSDSVLVAANLGYSKDVDSSQDLSPTASPQSQFSNFDLVITNPPYVSYGSRNQPEILDTQKNLLKSWYREGAEYKIRLHSIFQDIALRFCKAEGRAVLLVPDGFLTGSFYGRLRRLLLDKSTIVSLSELPEGTISGAVVGRWCVAQYRRKAASSLNGASDYLVQLHSHCQALPISYSPLISSIVSHDKSRFRLIFSHLDEQIFCAMKQLRILGTALRGHTGLRALNGQRQIISAQKEVDPAWKRGIKSGAQVVPYAIAWDGTWLRVDPALLYKGGFDASIISKPKIFVRQTADRLIASVDMQGLYHLNNVHSFSTEKAAASKPCDSKDGLNNADIYFYCALMNSSFWMYLYQMSTREQSRALAQVDIETVEALPLPLENARNSQRISQLSRMLHEFNTLMPAEPFAQGNPHADQTSVEPRRLLDRLVYDLYQLTYEQIDHVESYWRQLPQNVTDLPTVDDVNRFFDGRTLWVGLTKAEYD
jgi:adenine-specific DNA-methyltransferase